jgi:hypothetical protein
MSISSTFHAWKGWSRLSAFFIGRSLYRSSMPQLLLLPDPRPLVECLGVEFFRQAPDGPGVYLMRDATDTVLYVGKAKSLRKRLGSYRVANPDRMRRRHLRLLRSVRRIELQPCLDEDAALAREAALLRTLRPRFNRAGTWPGPPRFIVWRLVDAGLEIAVLPAVEAGWQCHGPLGAGAFPLRASLVRLLWCALHPERGLARIPAGWFHGRLEPIATIRRLQTSPSAFEEGATRLQALFAGDTESFSGWICERTAGQGHPIEQQVREADLEVVNRAAQRG